MDHTCTQVSARLPQLHCIPMQQNTVSRACLPIMMEGMVYPTKKPHSSPPRAGPAPYWQMYATSVYEIKAPRLMDQ